MPTSPYAWKDFPYSSHQVLCNWLAQLPEGTRVLDFGAGPGMLDQLSNLQVEGCDQVTPPTAHGYQTFWQCDLNGPWPFEDQRYDVIVAADILEHLHHPEAVLQRLSLLLNPNGVLMVSLPNVAHLSVRLSLLLGQFNRMDRGILDKTHLHFYTLKTAKALIQQAGFHIEKIQPTPTPVQLVFPWTRHALFQGLHALHAGLAECCPTLLGYQFVFWGRKSEFKECLCPFFED